MQQSLALILPDIRSAQNVGAILRTADAVGVTLVMTAGYTPHPPAPNDPRPPHVASSNARAIGKTALGAELTVPLEHCDTEAQAFARATQLGYQTIGLEQAPGSVNLFEFKPTGPIALVLGNEVDGLSAEALAACDVILELPMVGTKESLNVSVAAGIAMYQLRYGKIDIL